MADRNEAHRETVIGAEILARVPLQQHQLDSVRTPERPIAEIVGFSSDFTERPLSKWNREPDLAEAIKKRLSETVHVHIA